MSAVSESEEVSNLESKILTASTEDSKLVSLKKCLPSEKQCDVIIEKTVSEFERKNSININDINERIIGIEKSISKLIDIICLMDEKINSLTNDIILYNRVHRVNIVKIIKKVLEED